MPCLRPLRFAAAVALILAAALASPASADRYVGRTVYVDFAGGSNSNDGLSPDSALKTVPRMETLGPGSVVRFKGGVRYPRHITVTAQGAPGNPLVFDGNSDGSWGEGRAVIDGSDIIRDWTHVGETDEGLRIWRTARPDLGLMKQDFMPALLQDGRLGRLASSADVENNWISGQYDKFFRAPRARVTDTTVRHPEVLNRFADRWGGTWILIHHGNNHLKPRYVRGFDAETATLTFDRARKLRKGDPWYAILNHRDVFDAPGEIRLTSKHMLYIPYDDADPNVVDVRMPQRWFGIRGDGMRHVAIQGFEFRHHARTAVRAGQMRGPRGADVVIRDNVSIDGGGILVFRIDGAEVSGNEVRGAFISRGIFVRNSDRVRLDGNTVRRTRSGISLFGTVNSLVIGNDVRATHGVHGNALTLYEGSHNTRVIGNRVVSGRGPIGIALRESDDLLLAFNMVTGRRFAVAQWAEVDGGDRIDTFNNLFTGTVRFKEKTARRSRFQNNALAKLEMWKGREGFVARTHNIYSGVTEASVGPGQLREGEALLHMNEIYGPRVRRFDLSVTDEGRRRIPAGAAVAPAGVAVSFVGPVDADGRLPDLSRIGLPPYNEALAATLR